MPFSGAFANLARMNRRFPLMPTHLAMAVLALAAAPLWAQQQQQQWPTAVTAVPTANPNADKPGASAFHVGESVSVDESYVGDSHVRNGHTGLGDGLGESLFKFDYKASVPVSKQMVVEGVLGYHRFDFGSTTGSLTPQNLQSVGVGAGIGYKIDDNWSLLGSFTPEFQEVNGWNGSTYVHLTGGAGATYTWNPDLSLTFGLVASPGAFNTPVLPMASLKWRFADKWTLVAGLPRTSLTYALCDKVNLWGAASIEGGEFKTGDNYGTAAGRPDLNDRKLDYTEVRVGVGADYKLCPALTLTGELGSAVYRDFAFEHNNKIKADPSVLAELGIKTCF